MQFPEMSPYVLGLQWGSFGIRWYALAYIAGILLGWRYLVHLVRKERVWGGRAPSLTALQIDDLVLWVTAGVILGGRLGYVLFYMLPNAEQRAGLVENPLEVFAIWNGGMSFHGGLLGVALAVLMFSRTAKADLLRVGDLVAAAVPIGMFFGRIANFINGELWGRITDVPWAVIFCNDTIRAAHGGTCAFPGGPGEYLRHPSQIYEALLEGLLLFVILAVATHKGLWLRRRGAVAGLFLVGMAVFRTFVEQFRQPDTGFDSLPLGLTMGMMLSAPMLLLGFWLLWRALKAPADAAPATDAPPEAKPAPPLDAPAKPAAKRPATKGGASAKAATSKPAAKPRAPSKPPAKPKPKA